MCSRLGSSRSHFLPGLLGSSLSRRGHTLKFLSATQVLFEASWPEANSFAAILEVQGVAAGEPGQAESHTQPGLKAPGSSSRPGVPEKSLTFYLGSPGLCPCHNHSPGGLETCSSIKPRSESKSPVQNPRKHDISSSLNY